MEAFNVEEFVREYEKEILQRLSSHDTVQEREVSAATKHKNNLLSAFDETEEVATKIMEQDQTWS